MRRYLVRYFAICLFLVVGTQFLHAQATTDKAKAGSLIEKAKALIEKEDYKPAIVILTQAVALDPKNADAYQQRGIAYGKTENFKPALADFSQAVVLAPSDFYSFFLRGSLYLSHLDDPVLAIKDLNECVRLLPSNFGYFTLGKAYAANKDFRSAITNYTKAIDLDPKDAFSFYFRGEASSALGSYEMALSDYRKAVELDPNMPAFSNAVRDTESRVAANSKSAPASSPSETDAELGKRVISLVAVFNPLSTIYNEKRNIVLAQDSRLEYFGMAGCPAILEYKAAWNDLLPISNELVELTKNGSVARVGNAELIGGLDLLVKYSEEKFLPAEKDISIRMTTHNCKSAGTSNSKYDLAASSIDSLIIQYDAQAEILRKRTAKEPIANDTTATDCFIYNANGLLLSRIKEQIEKMAADKLPPYEKGIAGLASRKAARDKILVPPNCYVF